MKRLNIFTAPIIGLVLLISACGDANTRSSADETRVDNSVPLTAAEPLDNDIANDPAAGPIDDAEFVDRMTAIQTQVTL
ncbi:MAG: hypothetical protein ACI8Y4_003817 [Candidatus Poriferisodalaceae bacterium]|jgi:hypothetical protein